MFVDKVTVEVIAGDGGNGAVSFRHEKYIDKGGPDGGDGGKGGDVIVVGSHRTNTLANFRYQKEIKAKNGDNGSKRKRHGKSAPNLEVIVPVGTVIYNQNGDLVADIAEEGQKEIIAKGGRGGFGNAHFTSSVRQAPRVAEKGAPGDEYIADMELKMIAEVGLVGLPNAGKSTLLSVISNAKPEIANYPFTTIKPNLGVASVSDKKSLLVADIPGLIEGASAGKGLGDEFLRHVERTKVLLHLIDAYNEDPVESYKTIRKELSNYKVDISKKPEIILITKTENFDQEILKDIIDKLKKASKKSAVIEISSKSGHNLKKLMNETAKLVEKQKVKPRSKLSQEPIIITLKDEGKDWKVEKSRGIFVVSGSKIERFASQTDFDNFAGVERLRDIMRRFGVLHELERAGIEPGDKVQFGKNRNLGSFEY